MVQVVDIIPYPIVPPRSGGALRCYHVLRQLARFYEVHAIVFQREEQLRTSVDGYKVPDNVRIHSPLDTPSPRTVFDRLPPRLGLGLHYRWLRRRWRGPADNVLLRCHHLIRSISLTHSIDAVVFEELSAMMVAPVVKRLQPAAKRIVNLYNVNHLLMAKQLAEVPNASLTPIQRKAIRTVRWTEHHLGRYVDAFFACSDDDRLTLEQCSGIKGHTIPNGVDTRHVEWREPRDRSATNLLFCGSLGYQPNIDGLNWFDREIWPIIKRAVPEVRLTVIGRGGHKTDFGNLPDDPQVNWIGEVDDTLPFYHAAAVHVCPLRMGSGTRLKILESMSAGTPLVSTTIGAEGIEAQHDQHLLLADEPKDFAAAVIELLKKTEQRIAISQAARQLVEKKYDWDVIGNAMAQAIEEIAHGTH